MRMQRSTAALAVFLSGAVLMGLEIAAFRIVGRVFGTALRETTTVIAVFMTAMSIGYWGGGLAGDRYPRRSTLSIVLALATATIAAIPWLDHALSLRIADSATSLSLHALVASVSLFFLPTLLLAGVSPIAIRLRATEAAQSGTTAGSISALSTLGSIFGTVLTAFVLFDWLESVDRTVLVLAATLVIALILVMAGEAPRVRFRVAPAMTALAAVAVCTAAIAYNESASVTATSPATKNVLYEADSEYHHVVVRQHGGGAFRILQLDATTIQSSMIVRDPAGAGLSYENAVHLAKAARPDTRSMLVIGVGGGTVPKQFLRLYPEVTIDAVELDPLVARVAERLFFFAPSPRVRMHISDGRVFLEQAGQQAWDIITIDAYTANRYGSTIPPHMVTREFFAEAKRHLTPGGILHYHSFAAPNAPISRGIERTLAEVFPTVAKVSTQGFTEYFASTDAIDRSALMRNTKPLPWADLRPFAAALNTTPDWSAADPILTDDYAPIDTLLAHRGRS